jgi:geranylgeranyl diphosphate synthase, type II
MEIEAYFDRQRAKIEKALEKLLPRADSRPRRLAEAMRYAVVGGGKRIRPIFALAACEAVGGNEEEVMPAACALELIHSYSLVHDDLPCMDDDDVRRGRPTCHKRFGEDVALLAGDALLTLAFQVLGAPSKASAPLLGRRLEALHRVARAVGHAGMVGGQAVDIEFGDKEPDLPTIEYINTHKSGALIAVSAEIGGFLGGGSPRQVEALYRYGKLVGLLFQIVDDILDREGYAKVIGVSEARLEAAELLEKAKTQLKPFGSRGRRLAGIADFVFARTY